MFQLTKISEWWLNVFIIIFSCLQVDLEARPDHVSKEGANHSEDIGNAWPEWGFFKCLIKLDSAQLTIARTWDAELICMLFRFDRFMSLCRMMVECVSDTLIPTSRFRDQAIWAKWTIWNTEWHLIVVEARLTFSLLVAHRSGVVWCHSSKDIVILIWIQELRSSTKCMNVKYSSHYWTSDCYLYKG